MSYRIGVLIAVVFLLGADTQKDDAVKTETNKLQGTWRVVEAERDGVKAPGDETKKITLVIKGDKVAPPPAAMEGKDAGKATAELEGAHDLYRRGDYEAAATAFGADIATGPAVRRSHHRRCFSVGARCEVCRRCCTDADDRADGDKRGGEF